MGAVAPKDSAHTTDSARNRQVHVRGIASDVTLDSEEGVAIKVYRRNPFIQTLYRIAFQARFPYVDNIAALKAAKYRRRIAGLVTRYFLGEDVVAPVVAVERRDGRNLFVTKLVRGHPPSDHRRAREFLHQVTDAFIRTGLPTWQVSPYNPRSLGNVMETEDGHFRIIDLESNVVTPMVPLSRVWTSAREAHLPPFDDIDLLKLWRFISDNWQSIHERLGLDAAALVTATAKYAWYERLWHGEEPRLWSRGLRWMTRALDIPGHLRAIAMRISRWENNAVAAKGWLQTGIDRWQQEGVISQEQAAQAQQDLANAQTLTVLAHLGAHLAMSVPLRFPLGASARFLWTLSFRARAELRALMHRHVDEDTRRAREVHSLLVMAAALLPGVGAAAYVLSGPLRSNRILMAAAMDQALRLLPLRLYSRLHVGALTTGLAANGEHDRPLPPLRVARRTVRRGVRELRSMPAALIPVAFALVVAVSTVAYVAVTGNHDAVGDMGAAGSAKLAMCTWAAVTGIVYFRSFWRISDERTPGAAGPLFWLAAGLSTVWVGIDDYFDLHEAAVNVVPDPDFLETLLDNADRIASAVYTAAAILALRLFWGEIRRHPGAALLSVAAVSLGVGSLIADALIVNGDNLSALEEPLHLLAAGAITSAICVNYVEFKRRALR